MKKKRQKSGAKRGLVGLSWGPHCRMAEDGLPTHHVPDVVSNPVHDGVDAGDKLQVLGLGGALVHQEHHKAGRHEGHGHDNEDGDEDVRAFQPGTRHTCSTHAACVASTFPTHTGCVASTFPTHTGCGANTFPTHNRLCNQYLSYTYRLCSQYLSYTYRLCSAYLPTHTRCVANTFPTHTGCVANTFPTHTGV